MEAKMRTDCEPQVSSDNGYAWTNEAGRGGPRGESVLRRKREERQLSRKRVSRPRELGCEMKLLRMMPGMPSQDAARIDTQYRRTRADARRTLKKPSSQPLTYHYYCCRSFLSCRVRELHVCSMLFLAHGEKYALNLRKKRKKLHIYVDHHLLAPRP